MCVLWAGWAGHGCESVCLSAEEVTVTQPRSRACWALCPSPVHPAEQPQPGLMLPWALELGQTGLCELGRASFGLEIQILCWVLAWSIIVWVQSCL